MLETVFDDERSVRLAGFPVDLYADLLAQLLKLVQSGGPVDVRPYEADREILLREVEGQLPGGGGLSLSVESDHHYGLRLDGDPRDVAVDHPDELLADDPDHMVLHAPAGLGGLVQGTLLDAVGHIQDQPDVDVSLQKGALEILADVLDEFLVDRRRAADASEDVPQGFSQSFQHHC